MQPILFVEDDEMIASGLCYALEQEGLPVRHCREVAAARALLDQESFSLGLLDLSLPDGTGWEVCELLRARDVPVIFLTAVDDEGNAVRGLEMGADDYVTKPFRLRELIARIRGVLRRHAAAGEPTGALHIGELTILPQQAKVLRGGLEIELTAVEYRLLLVLAANRGQVLSRTQLLEGIWDAAGSFVNDNTLTVYVGRLRDKLEADPADPQLIRTVRGLGYTLDG